MKVFSSKIAVLWSYSVLDNVGKLLLFLREFFIAAL